MPQKMEAALGCALSIFKTKYLSRSTSHVLKPDFSSSYLFSLTRGSYPLKQTCYNGCWSQLRAQYSTCDEGINKKKVNHANKRIVYYGQHTSRIKGLKVVSFSTSLMTIIAQPYIYDSIMTLATPAIPTMYCIMGFFTFVTPLLIHNLAKKYVMEITYDPPGDLYTSKTMTFFLRDKVLNFKVDEIICNKSGGVFQTHFIKGFPVILFPEGFLDKDHCIKIMGYDKPIELKMDVESKDS